MEWLELMQYALNATVILGIGCLITAGWLVHPAAGFAVAGVLLLVIAVGIARITKGQ